MNEDTNSGGKGVARSAITGDNDNNSISKNQNVGEEWDQIEWESIMQRKGNFKITFICQWKKRLKVLMIPKQIWLLQY